ncbi:thioredoxin [Terasakiella pusilla]|uniref:thioredoxin n=1 Tax=Terasakiella pusilla TaxID=64973 RepID=UPI0012EB7F89|nr:thioredoxin [Terasakiella pusilla]
MMKRLIFAISVLVVFATLSLQARADQMVFVHSPGCIYCEMWREDILPIYDKTDEGKRLPLREVNLDKGMPDDLKHLVYPSFTPTFIILDDKDKEVGRILGYNSEFFWGFVQNFIKKLDAAPNS